MTVTDDQLCCHRICFSWAPRQRFVLLIYVSPDFPSRKLKYMAISATAPIHFSRGVVCQFSHVAELLGCLLRTGLRSGSEVLPLLWGTEQHNVSWWCHKASARWVELLSCCCWICWSLILVPQLLQRPKGILEYVWWDSICSCHFYWLSHLPVWLQHLLGSFLGIVLTYYLVLRKSNVFAQDLYQESGKYWYFYGVAWRPVNTWIFSVTFVVRPWL